MGKCFYVCLTSPFHLFNLWFSLVCFILLMSHVLIILRLEKTNPRYLLFSLEWDSVQKKKYNWIIAAKCYCYIEVKTLHFLNYWTDTKGTLNVSADDLNPLAAKGPASLINCLQLWNYQVDIYQRIQFLQGLIWANN